VAAAVAFDQVNPADLITAGVGVIEKLILLHRINEWTKLIFGFAFTFVTAYSTACGASLVSGHGWTVSAGTGLLSASGAITALFMLNPRTRGIMIVQDKKNLPDISDYQSLEKH
jgi:hypothetical protein